MIDTHSHIYAEEFDGDRAEALERAWAAGVEKLLLPDIAQQATGANSNALQLIGSSA